jgi:fibrillarin-like rRNA methylase
MKIGVVGCRHYNNYEFVKSKIDTFILNNAKYIHANDAYSAANVGVSVGPTITIISGGAKGVDRLAKEYANEMGYFFLEHAPQTDRYPSFNDAARARNRQIANDCDVLIAFPSATSVGTWDTVTRAKALNKPIYTYEI